MNRYRTILCILLLLLLLFSGCSALPGGYQESQTEETEDEEEWDPTEYQLNEDATVLTLACWMISSREAQLVDKFNRTHEDYQIQLVSYYDSDGSGNTETIEAAQNRMRTKLLTGDTPDLFYLDSMDVMALEQANLLMDLYPLMEADKTFNRDDYFMNVWDLYAVDGKLYEYVLFFAVRGLAGPKSLVGDRTGWTYSEMEDFIAECSAEGKEALDKTSMSYMIQASCAAYLDLENGTCRFDTDSFRQWMNLTKYITSLDSQDGVLGTFKMLYGVEDYVYYKALYQETPVLMGLPSEDGWGPYAAAINTFAISSTTEYPEVCWEFLRSLMTEEALEGFEGSIGMPMLRSPVEKQLEYAMLDPSDERYPWASDTYKMLSLTQEEADAFLNMIDSITHTKLRYDGVEDLIDEEMEAWLAGGQTMEQTIDYLQDRVGTYLAERS